VPLHLPQQRERPVQHAHVLVRRDDDGATASDANGAHEIAFSPEPAQLGGDRQPADQRRGRRRADHDRPVTGQAVANGGRRAEQSRECRHELVPRRAHRRRVAIDDDLRRRGAVFRQQGRCAHPRVAQPEIVAVLGAHCADRQREQRAGEEQHTPHLFIRGVRPSSGSAQRVFGTIGVQSGRSGSRS
jgi:hypothetical protein